MVDKEMSKISKFRRQFSEPWKRRSHSDAAILNVVGKTETFAPTLSDIDENRLIISKRERSMTRLSRSPCGSTEKLKAVEFIAKLKVDFSSRLQNSPRNARKPGKNSKRVETVSSEAVLFHCVVRGSLCQNDEEFRV